MKRRLIDATDLVSRVLRVRNKTLTDPVPGFGHAACNAERFKQAMHGGIRKVLREIETSPTIDAVEVVRCKDCLNCGMKASIKFDGYRDDARLCMVQHAVVLPDDYCSRGVKMDAEVQDD